MLLDLLSRNPFQKPRLEEKGYSIFHKRTISVSDDLEIEVSYFESRNRYVSDEFQVTLPGGDIFSSSMTHDWGTDTKTLGKEGFDCFIHEVLKLDHQEYASFIIVSLFWICMTEIPPHTKRLYAMYPSQFGYSENVKLFPTWYLDIALQWTRSRILK